MASQPSDRARKAAIAAHDRLLDPPSRIYLAGVRDGLHDDDPLVQAFATFERETPGFAAGVWSSDLSAAPHACHVLAARFNDDVGDWVMGVVASPPIYPYTHWRMLDTPAPPADLCADIAQKSGDALLDDFADRIAENGLVAIPEGLYRRVCAALATIPIADAIADLENQVSVADEAISEILAASRIEQAEAADAIASLLAPFAKAADDAERMVGHDGPMDPIVPLDACRSARAALTNAAAKHPTGER